MEVEYSALMTWSPHQAPPSESSSQWGDNIKIVGVPQRESGSRKKSFIADMFGFATDGELHNITCYLRSHGGFELEQVRWVGIQLQQSSNWSISVLLLSLIVFLMQSTEHCQRVPFKTIHLTV